MDGVKTLGFELLGPIDSFHGIAFPLLEVLEFSNMGGWETWSTRHGDNDGITRSFPCLGNISIRDCLKLVEISIDLIPSLRNLDIKGCSEEVLKGMVGLSSSIGILKIENIKGLAQLNGEVLALLREVEDLSIIHCDELRYLCESNSEASGEKGVNLGISMEPVREGRFYGCGSLESSIYPNSDESLVIGKCGSVTSLTSSMMHELPSSPKTLSDHYCDNVESISEKGFGILPLFCLKSLEISNCKNMKLLPQELLENLISLQKLAINNCPSMDSSFPCGFWPPNLRSLWIGRLFKPMSEWKMQNYPTSLIHLILCGENSGVVSFVANAEDVTSSSFLLPPSLITLVIHDFVDVESVSEVLLHLPCLKQLHIWSCPKLKDLPENTTDPLSLKIAMYK